MTKNAVGSLFPLSHYLFSPKLELPSLLHGMGCLKGVNAQLPMPHSCGPSSASSGMGGWSSSPAAEKELQKGGCKSTQLCEVLLERHCLGGHKSDTSQLMLKQLLWSRQLSFFRSFTPADAINTHLAGYPRTSWEERLLNAGVHQVW